MQYDNFKFQVSGVFILVLEQKKANKNYLAKICHREVRGSKREIIVASIEMNKELSRVQRALVFSA